LFKNGPKSPTRLPEEAELENQLDHFVLAKWMRAKKGGESVLRRCPARC
jgi:hypothetical protein